MLGSTAKRLKLTKEKNEYSSVDAESGFHSEIDFSSSATSTLKSTSIDNDLYKSPVKRRVLATRRASLNQNSLSSSDVQYHQQHQSSSSSSGYSSLLSSSSNLTSSISASSRQSRTPKKRKSEISESDENFYNSFQFISPLKIRKKDEKNCAKLVLKEKSCSENVILSSTPIRSNNEKWQKFRSFHPERIKDFGKSLDDDDVASNKNANFETSQKLGDNSLNISSFNLSNASFNLTSSVQQQEQQQDIPANLHNLWTDEIKPHESKHSISIVQSVKSCESQGSIQSSFSQSTLSSTTSERKKKFFNGRTTFDILGRLHANHDIALKNILNYLDDESLLSLSHVSKNYRKMIQSNKLIEIRRQNYLKATKSIKENKLPGSNSEELSTTIKVSDKKKRKAFTDSNKNENQMNLRRKQSSAPHSPSTRINEMHKKFQSQQSKTCKKCPRCSKPATIKKVKIRNSPRKKKSNIFCISTSTTITGRIQKRSKTFLSKTTIETLHESSLRSSPFYVSLADDELSRSPNRSSSCESPNSSSLSGDDMNSNSDEIYEYGVCESSGCSFKFCVKCNCKYHPRRQCADLSPPSPNRYFKFNESSGACTRASNKSLRRLAY